MSRSDDAAFVDATRAISDSLEANAPLIRRKSQFVFASICRWATDALLLLAASLAVVS